MSKTKLKNYTVQVIGYCTILVIGAKNEEEALEFASTDMSNGDFTIEECRIGRVVPNNELETERRNADVVSEE